MNSMLALSACGGRKDRLSFNGETLLFPDYEAFPPEFKTAEDRLGTDFISRQNRLSRTEVCRRGRMKKERILRKFFFLEYFAGKLIKTISVLLYKGREERVFFVNTGTGIDGAI